jgi:hypothetical protein
MGAWAVWLPPDLAQQEKLLAVPQSAQHSALKSVVEAAVAQPQASLPRLELVEAEEQLELAQAQLEAVAVR